MLEYFHLRTDHFGLLPIARSASENGFLEAEELP
jgi:hypothetical protein